MTFKKLLALCLLIIGMYSCGKKGAADFDSNFLLYSKYISSFSSGIVSANADVRVQLALSKTDWKPNQELDSDLFDISPSVSGKVVALSNNTVAFIPKNKLESNTVYQITLHLNELLNVPKEIEDFKFTIKTINQDFVVSTQDLQSYNQDLYYLNGTLKTADNLNFDDAKKIIEAEQGNDNLKIKFDKALCTATEFKFIIDSIKRFENETDIQIKWNGDCIDVDNKNSIQYAIPAKSDFKVLKIEIGDQNNQSLLINFSDELKQDQDFKGLISIQNTQNLKFATQGNVLKVFFSNEKPFENSTPNIKKPLQTVVTDSLSAAVDSVAVTETTQPIEQQDVAEPLADTDAAIAFTGEKLIEIFQGIENRYLVKIKENYSEKIQFDQINPEVRLVKSGTILPSSNNLKLNFEAANLKAVDVKVYKIYKDNILQFLQDNKLDGNSNLKQVAQPIAKSTIELKQNNLLDYSKWNTYALDLSKIIAPEPGVIYRIEFLIKKNYSLYKNSSESAEQQNDEDDTEEPENDKNYSGTYDDYDYYEGDYNYEDQEDPTKDYYYFNKKVATNVLASDLGVIVKRGENKSYFITVADIISTDAVSGATVDLYNFQQQKIASSTTDSDGMVSFQLDKMAYFALVTKNKSTTYVKLDDELSLSLSNFDVSGETLQKGLKGYLYGERGVWRPGDSLFIGFILNDNANKLPENHPIKFKLSDPNGKVSFENIVRSNKLNHYSFIVPTAATAPTGSWEAVVSIGGARFYKNIKIETIKPNRLKIKNSLANALLSSQATNVNNIQVLWLHGAIGKDLKTQVQAKFSQQDNQFKGFELYVFDDPTRTFSTEEVTLFSGKTDLNGRATIAIKPQLTGQAPGMLKAAFMTTVSEKGGDTSTDVFATTYSPYATYIGLKTPEPNRYGQLETRKNNRFEIVSVDENGKPKSVKNLDIKVYKIESRWWWDASSENLSTYSSSNVTTAFKSFVVTTNSQGKANVQFSVTDDQWGRYLIRVIDTKGGHATGATVYLDYPSDSGRTRTEDAASATMLRFTTNKSKYAVGDEAKIFIPSSAGGRALLSVENGTQVIKQFWIKTKQGETSITLPITPEMAPNVYLNVSLLQPHANTKNDLPIRLYGIVPIEVIDKNTILEPVLKMPNVLRPEQTVTVNVSELNQKPMTYTLAMIDEGLLDLTRFKTPNAWDSFYTRSALGVRTWDVYDDVIGAYGGKINQIFSIGGDADLGGSNAKKANRFKPVVVYLGPFTLKKGASAVHKIKIPKYIGSVRTMVVAANADSNAYGKTEKTTQIKSPLMVLASLPRKISPAENVIIPVTLFATEKNIKNVKLQIITNNLVRIIGNATQNVTFTTPDEKMAYFNLAVASNTGIGKIQIIATAGKNRSVYNVDIDVVNPNPITTNFTDVIITPNSSKTITWNAFGVAANNRAKIEASSSPMIDFSRRLDYLIQYPHGCAEQTTSAAFPQLYLNEVVDIDVAMKARIQKNVTTAIQKLGSFQIASGGFSYWAGQSFADDWATSYAGHFLIEAEKKGYVLPLNFKSKWLSYQQKEAKNWRFQKQYGNDLAQAYRLYTLALAGSGDIASMNRLRETTDISNECKLRLAATYALLKQNQAGLLLLNKSIIDDQSYNYYYGSADRNRAMALETLLLLGQKTKAFQMANQLAKNLSSDRYMNTQTTAYSLYVMAKFAESNGSKGVSIQFLNHKKLEIVQTAKTTIQRSLVTNLGVNSVVIKNNKNNTLYVRVLNSGTLAVGQEQTKQLNLVANVLFKDRNGAKVNVAKIAQGTEFYAEVTLKNTSNELVQNMALTQIIPSGFEIVNTRFTDFGTATTNNADYIDYRDDRANYYFELKPNETRKFKILLNASYLGKYYLPGLQCEAMYNNNYLARTKGQWVQIVQ